MTCGNTLDVLVDIMVTNFRSPTEHVQCNDCTPNYDSDCSIANESAIDPIRFPLKYVWTVLCFHTRSADQAFSNHTFHFCVGEEKVHFKVDARDVSRDSNVLGRMINGGFEEASERYGKLPEVEPEVFHHFISFCSTGYYTTTTAATDNYQQNGSQDIIRLENVHLALNILQIEDPKTVWCCGCRNEITREEKAKGSPWLRSFPFCSTDCLINLGRSSLICVFCCTPTGETDSVICEACESSYFRVDRGPSAYHYSPEFIGSPQSSSYPRHSLEVDRPKSELIRRELSMCDDGFVTEAAEHWRRKHDLFMSAAPNPLLHAKLYVFADMYDCASFKIAALGHLYFFLLRFDLAAAAIDEHVELLEYVYDNTVDRDDILRRIVVMFAAQWARLFLASDTAQDLFRSNGKIAFDFVRAVVATATVNDDIDVDSNSDWYWGWWN